MSKGPLGSTTWAISNPPLGTTPHFKKPNVNPKNTHISPRHELKLFPARRTISHDVSCESERTKRKLHILLVHERRSEKTISRAFREPGGSLAGPSKRSVKSRAQSSPDDAPLVNHSGQVNNQGQPHMGGQLPAGAQGASQHVQTRPQSPLNFVPATRLPLAPMSSEQLAAFLQHPVALANNMARAQQQPQMTQDTPAISHATPTMRNITQTQRPMGHESPTNHSNMAQAGTPQMNDMDFTPKQQLMLLQQRQAQRVQQQQMGKIGFTSQQLAQLQAAAHAQRNFQSHQQQHQQPLQKLPHDQLVKARIIRAQQLHCQQIQSQQNRAHHSSPQTAPQEEQQQQQQIFMAAAQTNSNQVPQDMQGFSLTQRYNRLYQQRLLRLRVDMSQRYSAQYGTPNSYPASIAQQYGAGLEKSAKAWIQKLMRHEKRRAQQQPRANQAAMQAQQMQQQNMMRKLIGMGN